MKLNLFAKRATTAGYAVEAIKDGYLVKDGAMTLKTPADHAYLLPTLDLAESIAEEWRAQGDRLRPETMPLTQLAATALDVISTTRDTVVASIAAHAMSDLLCHRAEQPPALTAQQAKIWQPWLDWAQQRYGVTLVTVQGVMPVMQAAQSLTTLRGVVAGYDLFGLAGLQQAVGATGSLILGLALAEDQATVEDLFNAAELESLFQVDQWGVDPITAGRYKSLRQELVVCEKWFGMLR